MFQVRSEDMSAERRPVAFGDLRGWIEALKAQGELAEIDGEGDWKSEPGTRMRRERGAGTGAARERRSSSTTSSTTTRRRAAAAASSAPRSTIIATSR